ncbi:MAG: hypothetical protein U0324_39030 [Polyangiales bacterium]
MRRNPFDLFAKDCLELLLEDAGRVERSVEVAVPAQLADAAFTPSPKGLAKLRRRGLLGRLARRRCAWECFHEAPSLADLRALVRKHLGWHALLEARARRKDRSATVPLPPLYVVCAARPSDALEAARATPVPEHGAGFYALSYALVGLCVIVVGELPKTRATLPLRVLGRDAVLDEALEEVAALKPGAWELRIRQAMVDFSARRRDGAWSADMEGIHERYARIEKRLREQGVRQGLSQGRAEGKAEGRLESLVTVAEVRLGRALTTDERVGLRARVLQYGPTRATRMLVRREPDALATWLADA